MVAAHAGGPHDLQRLVRQFTSDDGQRDAVSLCIRPMLFAIRWKLGELLGGTPGDGVGSRVPTLRDRLPEDLRNGPRPGPRAVPFRSVYQTDGEWTAELCQPDRARVMHIGWVPDAPAATTARWPC